MDKRQREKIMKQVKRERAARRQVELEQGLPRVTGKIHRTSKRDRNSRKQAPNTVRNWRDE